MRRRRLNVQLSEKQQLILSILLVIVVAISMLYCLGLASLALRQTWENAPLPWNGTGSQEGTTSLTPTAPPVETVLPATTPP